MAVWIKLIISLISTTALGIGNMAYLPSFLPMFALGGVQDLSKGADWTWLLHNPGHEAPQALCLLGGQGWDPVAPHDGSSSVWRCHLYHSSQGTETYKEHSPNPKGGIPAVAVCSASSTKRQRGEHGGGGHGTKSRADRSSAFSHKILCGLGIKE